MQRLYSLLTYITYDVMQDSNNFPSISLYLNLKISFVLAFFSIKAWFYNRAKNEASLEIIQYLQTDYEQLKRNSALWRKTQPS